MDSLGRGDLTDTEVELWIRIDNLILKDINIVMLSSDTKKDVEIKKMIEENKFKSNNRNIKGGA